MKIQITKILLAFLCITYFNAAAQPLKKQVKTEMASSLKNKTLIVLLKSENKSVTKKLSSQDELKEYRDNILHLNNNLEFVMKKIWTFNKSVIYLTEDKISAIKNSEDYAIISLDLLNIRFSGSFTIGPANQILRLHVCEAGNFNPEKPVFYQDIVGVPSLLKRDLIFAAQMVQNHLEARLQGKPRRNGNFYEEAIENAGILESKTLLIDPMYLDDNLKEEDIKKYYTYPFKISNAKEIETAQINRDSRYAYVYLYPLPAARHIFIHCIMDCKSGQSLSYSDQAAGHNNNYIDSRHLKKYVLYSDYYVNKKKGN